MATYKDEIIFQDREDTGWIQAINHRHNVSISDLQTRFKNTLGQNRRITKVSFSVRVYTQAKTAIGNNAHIDLCVYFNNGEEKGGGTRIMYHEDIPCPKSSAAESDNHAQTYTDDISSYFTKTYPFNFDTTYPIMQIYYATDNVAQRKMHCIWMKFIVESEDYVDYTINFNSNGGSSVSNLVYKQGTTISSLPTPTKTHYNFDYWINTSSNSVVTTPFTLNGNMNLQAHWTGKPVKVRLDALFYTPIQGTCSVSGGGEYKYGDTVTITAYNFTEHTIFSKWVYWVNVGSHDEYEFLASENPYTFTIDESLFQDKDNYEIDISAWPDGEPYYFSIDISPPEGGYVKLLNGETVIPNKNYLGTYGSSTKAVYAYPNEGFKFSHWSNGETSTSTYFTILENDSSYTAYFEQNKLNNFLLDIKNLSKLLLNNSNVKKIYIDTKKL